MQLFLYLFGSSAVLGAALAMAFLPRLAPSFWIFLLAGGLLSGLMAGGWTLQTASGGADWPRLRMGPVLISAGVISLCFGVADRWWAEMAWGVVGILVGIPIWVAARRGHARSAPDIRPPLARWAAGSHDEGHDAGQREPN